MHPLMILLHLAAAVMLLLWAVRMVRTGVERAFGSTLRHHLRAARGGLPGMAGLGLGLAMVLQSATAVGVLAAGFVASGVMPVPLALAALLGADLGSALVVRVLSLDLSALVPLTLLVGAVLFLKFERRAVRQAGRIVMGIGFVLMSLQMIGQATEPLRESAGLRLVIGYLQNDPITAFVVVAVLTWAMHSSVAMVLLLAALAQGGVLPIQAAVPMVMGANFGAGLIAVWLTRGMPAAARRVPMGNLLLRGAGTVLATVVLWLVAVDYGILGASVSMQIVHLHLAFNFGLVLLGLPLVPLVARSMRVLLPDPQPAMPLATPHRTALDPTVLDRPALALTCVKREVLLMGGQIEDMFAPIIDTLAQPQPGGIARLRTVRDDVSSRHRDIKLYMAKLHQGNPGPEHAAQAADLTETAINFDHIADIIGKTLLPIAEEKHRRALRFSDEGWAEMRGFHAQVLANLQLALNVLISGDSGSAQQLMREKETLRRLERASHSRHIERLVKGNGDSLATSDLHLEAVRAFKDINSLLVTVAHPILAQHGLILHSRLAPAQGISNTLRST